MNLFAKEKGIIFNMLNAILIIWLLVALVMSIQTLTNILVKDYRYTYNEYEVMYCNLKYVTKDECHTDYDSYMLDRKNEDIGYKKDIIISASNVILVLGGLCILNREKKKKDK